MDEERERLKVIEAARLFGELCVDIAQRLPRHAPVSLRTQLARSSQSISDLIAEGFGRGTPAEIIHYNEMAGGSLAESQNQLRRCVNRRLIDKKTFFRPWNLSVAISRMLEGLTMYFEGKLDEGG